MDPPELILILVMLRASVLLIHCLLLCMVLHGYPKEFPKNSLCLSFTFVSVDKLINIDTIDLYLRTSAVIIKTALSSS